MDYIKSEEILSSFWFRFINIYLLIWTISEKELDEFLNQHNSFYLNLKFTIESSKKTLNFLNVNFKVLQGEFIRPISRDNKWTTVNSR